MIQRALPQQKNVCGKEKHLKILPEYVWWKNYGERIMNIFNTI